MVLVECRQLRGVVGMGLAMNEFPIDIVLGRLGASRPGTVHCPAHDDRTPSLEVSVTADGVVLLRCHAGCATEVVVAALGLRMRDLFPPRDPRDEQPKRRIVATYSYLDEEGVELFQCVRFDPKGFAQRHNMNGQSVWNLRGCRRVLYRYPQVLEALENELTIYVCEGEEDVHTLERAGVVATCNPMGAGKWKEDYSAVLRRARVVVVADRDEPGRLHAARVAMSLREVDCLISVVEPAQGKDATDHFELGKTLEDFVEWPQGRIEELVDLRNTSKSEPVLEEAPIPLGHQLAIPPFPVDVLPEWLQQYVLALADATQTPVDLPAMLSLAVLATTAARKVKVEVRPGWYEPVNLYIAVAMPSGSRKSPVFARVTAPLMAWERQALDWARPDITDATARKRIAEDLVRQAEKIAASADPEDRERLTADAVAASESADEITVPPAPRLLADDATPEAVASLLAEQGGRLAILSAEGDLFDIMAGRYSKTPNFGVFLKGWSGDDLRVDRKGRPPEHVEHPALTLGLAVQPEVLVTMARQPGFRGRGMPARFLYALPPSNVGRRRTDAPPVPEAVESSYGEDIHALASSMAELEEPVSLTMSSGAAICFKRFEAALEPRLHSGTGDLGHIADWGAKLAGHTARIAGLLHLAAHLHDGWGRPIEADTVESAITIAEYLAAHALAVFDLMGADPVVADARAIVGWLERTNAETFTRRECHRALESRFTKSADLDPALTLLEDRGWVRRTETVGASSKGGRPASPAYLVNESWRHNRQNRHNSAVVEGSVGCVGSVGHEAHWSGEKGFDFHEDDLPFYSDEDLDRWAAEEDPEDFVLDGSFPLDTLPPCRDCGAPAPRRRTFGWSACQHQLQAAGLA